MFQQMAIHSGYTRASLQARRPLQRLMKLSQAFKIQASTQSGKVTIGEKKIEELLTKNLKHVAEIDVKDISGGCGEMYEVHVVSEDFRGKRMVQQHRLVNEILKEEVKKMHALRINTSVPHHQVK